MRNKIVFYLFIFSVLFTVFIYVNDKKILDSRDEKITNLKSQVQRLNDEVDALKSKNNDLQYFSLAQNEDAITYFENQGIEAEFVLSTIEDEIISKNKASEDNELVPFEGMNGSMRINKVKVLNHKWIIADFTDGTYWGEIFLSYTIGEKGEYSFQVEKSFLYPKS